MERLTKTVASLALLLAMSGCIVYTVADTAVGVTTSVVGAAVDVTTGAVGGAVDLVTDDDDEVDPEDLDAD